MLDQLLARHSPLVIGYSGWDGDLIMEAIKRRLKFSLPYNLYWFLSSEREHGTLPTELKDHPNVIFVIPEPIVPVKAIVEDNAGMHQYLLQ